MKVTQVSLWQQLRSLLYASVACSTVEITGRLAVICGYCMEKKSVAYAAGARSVNCQRVTQRAN